MKKSIRARSEETGRFVSIECGVACKCTVCGGDDVAWKRDTETHVCIDCYNDCLSHGEGEKRS